MRSDEQCNAAAVATILSESAERRPLSSRTAREGIRRVERLSDRYILKQFEFDADEPPLRRPWRREHEALRHLRDERLPASVGYATESTNGKRIVRYVREFVPGEPLPRFDRGTAVEAGALLASLHDKGVVTDDALTQNFLRAPDGRLFFLDFGKARIFGPHSLALPVWIALEHCRFLRASLGGDRRLWETFRLAYFDALDRGRVFEAAVRGLSRVVLGYRRWRRRDGGAR